MGVFTSTDVIFIKYFYEALDRGESFIRILSLIGVIIAAALIQAIVRKAEVGEIYDGKVVRVEEKYAQEDAERLAKEAEEKAYREQLKAQKKSKK